MSKKKKQKTKEKRNYQVKISFTNSEFQKLLEEIGLDFEEVTDDRAIFSKHIGEYIRETVIRKRPRKIEPINALIHSLSGEVRKLTHYLEGVNLADSDPYLESIKECLKEIVFSGRSYKKGEDK